MDYIPILGEYKNNKISIAIISKIDKNIIIYIIINNNIIETINFKINKFNIEKLEISNIYNNKYLIKFDNDYEIKINPSNNYNINIISCDCQFVPETDLWNKIDINNMSFSFHIGDQIYLDLIFHKYYNKYKDINSIDKNIIDEILTELFNEYLYTYNRKKIILLNSFNIILNDDHEIVDDQNRKSFSGFFYEKLIEIFKSIAVNLQRKLRIDNNDIIHINDKMLLLVDNINILEPKEYAENIINIIDKNLTEFNKFYKNDIYILSPQVIINNKRSFIDKIILKTNSNIISYDKLYHKIFSLFNIYRNVKIFCGDFHSMHLFKIKYESYICLLYIVGPINSIIDISITNLYLENFNIENIYTNYKHGYITISNNKIKHYKYDSIINSIFGPPFIFGLFVKYYLLQ